MNNFFLFGFLFVSAVLAQSGGGGFEGVSGPGDNMDYGDNKN